MKLLPLHFAILLIGCASLLVGCASTQSTEIAPPAPVESAPAEVDAYQDPETRRFADAYTRLFCKANYGYDPDSTVATLREPIKHMKKLKEDGSDLFVGYKAVLTGTGFATLGAFADTEARLRADEDFWYDFQSKLMDSMSSCQ